MSKRRILLRFNPKYRTLVKKKKYCPFCENPIEIYRKKDLSLELIPNEDSEFTSNNFKLIVNIYSGDITIISLEDDTIVSANLVDYKYSVTDDGAIMTYDNNENAVELSFDLDGLLVGVTITSHNV